MIDAGTILQMIRMEHHITRHELAKQFGTTYETIKEIEDNNGDVPDEWLILRNAALLRPGSGCTAG